MRFLVNENVSGTIIRERRSRGHDVLSAKEAMRGQPGRAILERAAENSGVWYGTMGDPFDDGR